MAREPLHRAGVLLRFVPTFLFVALAGACEIASVNVLEPLPVSAMPAPEGGTPTEAGLVDAMVPHDAADVSTVDDAAEDTAGTTPDGSACDLTATGEPCTASAGCCSGLCALDPTSKLTCRPTNGCLGNGRSCELADACCSLACISTGTDHACGASPLCAFAGDACIVASDCCANLCAAGKCVATSASCEPAGESCGNNGDCCSNVCANGTDGLQRCALLQACRAIGEICEGGADCCSATCTLDTNGVGHCAALPSCTTNDNMGCTAQVDDVCGNNNDCCSRQCLPASDGARRCAPAGGCRTECELCGSNGDCCSGSCVSISESVSICQASGSCGQDGEGCAANPQCCAMGPGVGCIEKPPAGGFHRCHSQPPPPPDGGAVVGGTCALPDECTSGFCVSKDGTLTCASSCAADGLGCTDRADCCDPFSDCMNERGSLVCAPLIH